MKQVRNSVKLLAAIGLACSTASWAADKPTIKIGYVAGWSDSVATTFVAGNIIKEKLGYPVELVPVAAGIMWQGVARGDLDATLSAWLPVTHSSYYDQYKDKVIDLGANYPGAKIGLIVPDYVKVRSVSDLEAQKTAFQGRIVGIDAGAGVMKKTEEAIKTYGLDYKLLPSSDIGMTSELARSVKDHKAVAVTGWIPHWMFAKWKLRFLEDPKKVYGEAEHVDSVISPELNAKAPQVVAFLKKFSWKAEEVGAVMLDVQNGNKPEAAAEKWIKTHGSRVDGWLH
ncbi:glycine betaine ABC transporter substrate-binding protein [Crenobacter sp. SG2305]|uniref:glycine betaine ABC transporter substrate-binding protein n=1 Tax=Crenobacter oryzisoli TaxID=3056844 RepID=UPI0025AACDB1|nr:glycine betaine ABC transporter substrate-binding protein [Crenobacter sp. SG2305]MDN0085328.1 glycine betaine ABC transporter substrate-binding protein [Crenobacter sp. SG2305]